MPTSHLELIELTQRAREFLHLEVAESQAGLVSTVAQSYADALFPPDYDNGPPQPWIIRQHAPFWIRKSGKAANGLRRSQHRQSQTVWKVGRLV